LNVEVVETPGVQAYRRRNTQKFCNRTKHIRLRPCW
jgi:hypothetical protein